MEPLLNRLDERDPAAGFDAKSEPVAVKRRVAWHLGHLDALESEAIHIMREVAGERFHRAIASCGKSFPSRAFSLSTDARRHRS